MNARQLLSEIVRCEPDPPADTPLQNLEGWDSIIGVRLVLRLEGILGRELGEDEIDRLHTVGDVENILKTGS